jgi:FkbM family methyltransferase
MSIMEGLKMHYKLFGAHGVLLAAKARLLRSPLEIAVSINGISHPMHLRLRTTDVSLFEEIIVNSEYSFEPSISPKIIVDAGANIGATSVYFANKFPRAKIIAVEPEQSNFEMLKKNASYYPNIVPVQAALWRENKKLSLANPGTGNWGYQTRERNGGGVDPEVDGITIDRLMERYHCDYIDILKVDIEGAEKEVFENPGAWIGKVGGIIIELHDHAKSGCSASVHSAVKDFESRWRKGETTFFVRKRYAASGPLRALAPADSAGAAAGGSRPKPRFKISSVAS